MIALTLTPAETERMLAETRACPPPLAGLRAGAALARLVDAARRDPRVARRLGAALARALEVDACRFDRCSLRALAELWARERDRLGGKALAALLWAVARNPGAGYRKLEDRLAEEVELFALRLLGAAGSRTGGGRDEL